MTLDEIRRRLSELAGFGNPIPPSLDFLVKIWPEGWKWYKSPDFATGGYAIHSNCGVEVVSHRGTGDFLFDFARLLLAIVTMIKEYDQPAFKAWVVRVCEEVGR